jgi:hypothetical protein
LFLFGLQQSAVGANNDAVDIVAALDGLGTNLAAYRIHQMQRLRLPARLSSAGAHGLAALWNGLLSDVNAGVKPILAIFIEMEVQPHGVLGNPNFSIRQHVDVLSVVKDAEKQDGTLREGQNRLMWRVKDD